MTTRTVELIRKEPAVRYIEELKQSEAHLAEQLDTERIRSGLLLVLCLVLTDYKDLVALAVQAVTAEEYEEYAPDPERIHVIDDGNYQGTLVFVIGEKDYQPSQYYAVAVSYGSCSGCDTLAHIRASDYQDDDKPTAAQVTDYFTLVLHIVQKLRVITTSDNTV